MTFREYLTESTAFVITGDDKFLTYKNKRINFSKNYKDAYTFKSQQDATAFEDKYANDIEPLTYIKKIVGNKVIEIDQL